MGGAGEAKPRRTGGRSWEGGKKNLLNLPIPTCKPLTPATHMAARLANAASLASAILLPSRTISASLRHEVLLLTVVSNGAK